MIENRLSFIELSNFLSPIIALKNLGDSMISIEQVFDISIPHVDDLYNYLNKYYVQFEGFRLHIREMKKNAEGHIHLHFQLRIDNKWWHNFTLPEKKVIKAIQDICKNQVHNLKFSKYSGTVFEKERYETKSYLHSYYYDSMAFNNSSSEDGIALSPLIIGFSNNGKYRFVEFNFCALSYEKQNSKVLLKDNWRDFMYY
jgi:hypothetical protein